jgi:tetratricopeptide (TPR) repeat protein
MFRDYVLRGALHALELAQADAASLTPEEREQILHALGFALDLPETWPVARDLLVEVAPKLEQAGYREEWIPYLRRGIDRCRAMGESTVEAELALQLGILLQFMGQLEAAREHYALSAARAAAGGNRHQQARALNRLAFSLRLLGRLEEAEATVHQATDLLEPEDVERAYSEFVRGIVALERGNRSLAIERYRQAMDIWERHGDVRMVAWTLNNLGSPLRSIGQYQEAIACYRRAIDLMQQIGDPLHAATARANLGNVYMTIDQPERALALYVEAEQVFRQTHDHFRLANITTNLGRVYRRLGRWPEARQHLEASIHLYDINGHQWGRVNARDSLAEVELDLGRYAEAEAILREAWALVEAAGEGWAPALAADVAAHLEEAIQHQVG